MATIKSSRCYRFNLLGYSFLIWKKLKRTHTAHSREGIVDGSCKLVRLNDYIGLAMPDGTIIPHQLHLDVESPLNDAATATVKVFVSID